MDPQGYDAGKKVTGRKRHILVDTLGLLLSVAVHPADIQDRDGAAFVLNASTRALFPFIERIFADGGYQGPRAAEAAAATGKWIIEIVKRNELHKFVVCPGSSAQGRDAVRRSAAAWRHGWWSVPRTSLLQPI
jgi:transposase